MGFGAEAVRQQFYKCPFRIDTVFSHQINLEVILAELPHHLAADTAGRKHIRNHPVLSAADGDGGKRPFPVVNGLKKGGALGAVGSAIGAVFDIAAAVDLPVGAQQRRADLIAGIGSVGVAHGLDSPGNQFLRFHHFSSSLAKLFPSVS